MSYLNCSYTFSVHHVHVCKLYSIAEIHDITLPMQLDSGNLKHKEKTLKPF